jgi:hypothetical protein
MGKLNILGIQYNNPDQVDQSTLKFATNIPPYNNVVPGGVWQPNYGMAIPQPGTFEKQTVEPKSNPILVNQQPKPLASDGIKIPGSSVVFRNPA